MLIDIDWSKEVNDKYGHDMGDKVLQKVAEEIKGQVRGSDITFRWSGEEFLVFLPNTRTQYAKQIAENLRMNLCYNDYLLLRQLNIVECVRCHFSNRQKDS